MVIDKQKRVAAIHDISCVGRCSLTVALPILSVGGFDTSVLPTAILSTHTGGFEGFTYRDLTEDIQPISEHWKSLNLQFDGLYSGFLGSYEQIDLVAHFFNQFRGEETLVMVDPAMADNGVLYSVYSPEMATGMAKLCSMADIIVPNLTESAMILNEQYIGEYYSQQYIEETLMKLSALGAKQIVLTGVSFAEGELGAACYDSSLNKISYAFNDRIPGHFHGTGDVFASALLAGLLNSFTLEEAVQIAVDYTLESIKLTEAASLERRYGVCFEKALPFLIKRLGLLR